MGLLRRAGGPLVRPVYKAVAEGPLWWFLAKVKAFFFAETSERLLAIENRLATLEKVERQIEAGNAAQWDALEQLLLAMYRQPECRNGVPDKVAHDTWLPTPSTPKESNRVNGPNTVR